MRAIILSLVLFTLLIHVEATSLETDPDAGCKSLGGKCTQGCNTLNGGKWVFGKCSKTIEYCCVGGQNQPVKGSQPTTFFLVNQAFTNQFPGALVYIPSSFDVNGPLNVVIFIHGFGNCIENSVRNLTDRRPCRPGGSPCFSFALLKQIEEAQPQAILILPEVAVDQRNGDPGRLGLANGFRNFLNELFSLLDITKGKTVSNINSVQLFSFSGAYRAIAQMATVGNVPATREIVLLDSLYGSTASLTNFAVNNLANFGPQPTQYRFANIWGPTTATNSITQMKVLQSAWSQIGKPASQFIADSAGTKTLTPVDYVTPIIFKSSSLEHNTIPSVYFGPFVAATYGKNMAQARANFGRPRMAEEATDLIDALLDSHLDQEKHTYLHTADVDIEADLELPF